MEHIEKGCVEDLAPLNHHNVIHFAVLQWRYKHFLLLFTYLLIHSLQWKYIFIIYRESSLNSQFHLFFSHINNIKEHIQNWIHSNWSLGWDLTL